MHYLFVICGVFSALFCLLLFTKQAKLHEHKFLGTIFSLITINCLFIFSFSRANSFYYVPIFSELNYSIPLLYGPLLWLYARALTTKNFKFGLKEAIHFLPFAIFFIIILLPLITNLNLPQSSQLGYPLIKLVQAPYYLFAVLFLLSQYRKQLQEEYSYQIEMNLQWLTWIVFGGIILWLIASVSFVYNLFNEEQKILLYDYYTLSFLACFLFGLAFVAMKKTDLFNKQEATETAKKIVPSPKTNSHSKSQIEDKNDFERLLELMESEKPYLDPLLTLNKLSKLSSIPSYRITRILNTLSDSNFYDFINKYRVDKVKEMLESGSTENYSMLGIATESGFNSKASFNRIFKKLTDMTPSQYLEKIKA